MIGDLNVPIIQEDFEISAPTIDQDKSPDYNQMAVTHDESPSQKEIVENRPDDSRNEQNEENTQKEIVENENEAQPEHSDAQNDDTEAAQEIPDIPIPSRAETTSSISSRSTQSNFSLKSWKSFIQKFKRVYLIVNFEKAEELVSNVDLIHTLALVCDPKENQSRNPSRFSGISSEQTADSVLKFPTFEIVPIPKSSEKFSTTEFYSFYNTCFMSLQSMENYLDDQFEENQSKSDRENFAAGVKYVQHELFMYLFQCCDRRKMELFSTGVT